IQQPAPAQPAPVVITPPAGGAVPAAQPALANNDLDVQTAVDKQISDDPTLSPLGITSTVMNGKVTLLGSVNSEALKARVERTVSRIKGVKAVDNQISVIPE